jgi:hypothetical protein
MDERLAQADPVSSAACVGYSSKTVKTVKAISITVKIWLNFFIGVPPQAL